MSKAYFDVTAKFGRTTPREGTVEWDRETNQITFGAKYDREPYTIRADQAMDILAQHLDRIKAMEAPRRRRKLRVHRGLLRP